jgi:hypothetical protein
VKRPEESIIILRAMSENCENGCLIPNIVRREVQKMIKGKQTIYIDAPLEVVYDFCRNPQNWMNTPVGIPDADDISGNGDVGTRARFTYSINGRDFESLVKITETSIDEFSFETEYKLFAEFEEMEIHAVQTEKGTVEGQGCEYTVRYEYILPENLFENADKKHKFEEQMEIDTVLALAKLKSLCEDLVENS